MSPLEPISATMTESPRTSLLTWDVLEPPRSDRVLIVGQTGSGKTTVAEVILRRRPYVVVIDTKQTINWPGYEVHRSLESLVQSNAPKLTYRPTYREFANEAVQNMAWEWIYQRGNTTVYVDETAQVTRNAMVFPFYYGACFMQGREMGVEMISSTQRPSQIPGFVFSESEHVYAFRLRLRQDRKRVEDLSGIPEEEIAALPKHRFMYARQDGEILGPLKLALR